jgi:hypothetical protein
MESSAVEPARLTARGKSRVARHRTRSTASGSKRVEVTVPLRDATLVKAIAGVLRTGGQDAERLRALLRPIMSSSKAKTGSELVAFFRGSPVVGADLGIERDTSTGRSPDLA